MKGQTARKNWLITAAAPPVWALAPLGTAIGRWCWRWRWRRYAFATIASGIRACLKLPAAALQAARAGGLQGRAFHSGCRLWPPGASVRQSVQLTGGFDRTCKLQFAQSRAALLAEATSCRRPSAHPPITHCLSCTGGCVCWLADSQGWRCMHVQQAAAGKVQA